MTMLSAFKHVFDRYFHINDEEYYEVNKKGYTKIVMQEWNASSMLKTTEIRVFKKSTIVDEFIYSFY